MLGNIYAAGNESWWKPKVATLDASALVDIIIHYPSLRTQALERLRALQPTNSYQLSQIMMHVPTLKTDAWELMKKCNDHHIADLVNAFGLVIGPETENAWKLIEGWFTSRTEQDWSVADGDWLTAISKSASPYAERAKKIIEHIGNLPAPDWKVVLDYKHL